MDFSLAGVLAEGLPTKYINAMEKLALVLYLHFLFLV